MSPRRRGSVYGALTVSGQTPGHDTLNPASHESCPGPSADWPGTEIKRPEASYPICRSQWNIGLDSTERNVVINRRAACGIIHAPLCTHERALQPQTACGSIFHLCIVQATSGAWVLRITVHLIDLSLARPHHRNVLNFKVMLSEDIRNTIAILATPPPATPSRTIPMR